MSSAAAHAVVVALGATLGAAPLAITAASSQVPVTPDSPTARQWLHDELTNPIYHQGPSLLERFLTWLRDLFDGVSVAGLSGGWAALVLVAVIAVIAAVALYVSGPVRRSRRARHAPVLGIDDIRSADDLLAAASRAASLGDFGAATLDAFRALARRSEERTILDPAPGRTAHEAALMIGARLPGLAPALADGATSFDAIYYGKVPADSTSYEQMRGLEAAAAATRPTALTSAPATVAAP
ncbi:protein of unknown function [Sanguibacter gelidistatuariae]|uniref:Protein-glutamine gamma-glutamyltransferase-like C-terminal domain-containing protein n=1 Tax=Sanguibacter gelidistatuariae TaxID=1814289 RepID=A0A1G6VUC7_9MICO|nr:DUF4129 domain-containing protein [Sanguibacter gelidistatuariae]SDD57013.1 protein of unknown function [Sanguibacter gelidistatuariae]